MKKFILSLGLSVMLITPSFALENTIDGKKDHMWGNMVELAINLSKKSNGGKPKFLKICVAEKKFCSRTISFIDKKRGEGYVQEVYDENDHLMNRFFVWFLKENDSIKFETNFDTGEKHKLMFDTGKDEWIPIDDEDN